MQSINKTILYTMIQNIQNKPMRSIYILSVLLIFFMSACEYGPDDIEYSMGSGFIDDPADVVMIDTIQVKTFTTVIDTFKTSGATRLLAGRYVNDYDIETVCESYFRLDPCNFVKFRKSSQFDSLCLVLYLDGYRFGDTTKTAKFDVYRVAEEIEANEYTGLIFNRTRFETSDEPIGSFSVDFSDREMEDSVSVRLSDAIGHEFYRMVEMESDTLNDEEIFKNEYFHGLSIKPADENNSLVIGINAVPDSSKAPTMRMYYSDNTIADNKYLSFPLEIHLSGTNFLAYSYIANNYENSFFEGTVLTGKDFEEKKLSSTQTNNVTFIQSGLMSTRIELPDVKEYKYVYGISAILKAEMLIEPLNGSFISPTQLPSLLNMNIVDSRNTAKERMRIIGGSKDDVEYGELNFDNEFVDETYYSYNISHYVQTEYQRVEDHENDLLLMTSYNPDKPNVDQIIIGDAQRKNDEMKLKIYLSSYNKIVQPE